MKQSKLALLSTLVLAGATFANVAGVKAADEELGKEATTDTPATATTTGEFSVKAGQLTLDAAPDFNFGETGIAKVAAGVTLDQKDNTVTLHDDDHTATDGRISANAGVLQVSDFRGAGSKWTLNAVATPFTNGTTSIDGTITLAGVNDKATISTTDATVWNSETAATDGAATKNVSMATGARLALPATKSTPGTYQSKITWTLSDVPAESTAKG
ncbi:WxL domain-containing protein [Latilactobacillus curvatus]|uniref:WxL domain-containing protein n=1 Tax=Latilactobacillus curvatus TaxID=28038 RepID=UPI000FECD563|nr:WxL domain-containing protein [Latilactobacillus curvatus]MDG2980127.1 WxL domain-containing protein [Latilactobacillus curvatus]MDT3394422.1 WxL domain-containing protein [Bacillota bacterium]QAR34703.1 hypothetical protein EQK21_00920 [Latilactobacillus curvatus]